MADLTYLYKYLGILEDAMRFPLHPKCLERTSWLLLAMLPITVLAAFAAFKLYPSLPWWAVALLIVQALVWPPVVNWYGLPFGQPSAVFLSILWMTIALPVGLYMALAWVDQVTAFFIVVTVVSVLPWVFCENLSRDNYKVSYVVAVFPLGFSAFTSVMMDNLSGLFMSLLVGTGLAVILATQTRYVREMFTTFYLENRREVKQGQSHYKHALGGVAPVLAYILVSNLIMAPLYTLRDGLGLLINNSLTDRET